VYASTADTTPTALPGKAPRISSSCCHGVLGVGEFGFNPSIFHTHDALFLGFGFGDRPSVEPLPPRIPQAATGATAGLSWRRRMSPGSRTLRCADRKRVAARAASAQPLQINAVSAQLSDRSPLCQHGSLVNCEPPLRWSRTTSSFIGYPRPLVSRR
jgi:hypothetical protein